MVSRLRHGRLGKLCPCDIGDAVPPRLDLETHHVHCRHAALGARKTGFGFARAEVLPAFPQKQWPITTRELLGHLGGIRHYNSESQDDPESGNTRHFENGIEAGLRFFANDPLVAQPGSHFHYSTQGYTLVGCAIEGASGEKYGDYVRERIFSLRPGCCKRVRTIAWPSSRFARASTPRINPARW